MTNNTLQVQIDPNDIYHLHLQGTMKSHSVDWCGRISTISLEQGQSLLVSFVVDPASLNEFLSQFIDLDLNIELLSFVENESPMSIECLDPITNKFWQERDPDALFLSR